MWFYTKKQNRTLIVGFLHIHKLQCNITLCKKSYEEEKKTSIIKVQTNEWFGRGGFHV